MKAGRKRHVIGVVETSLELDEYGNPKKPEIKFNIRCNVQILSASTFIAAGASLNNEYVSIMSSYDSRVSQGDFILWKNKYYQIEMIKPDEKDFNMIMTCVSKDNVEVN